MLTSCPSCLQGLKRYNDDAGIDADYIVVEMARHLLGPDWLEPTCNGPTRAASNACSSDAGRRPGRCETDNDNGRNA